MTTIGGPAAPIGKSRGLSRWIRPIGTAAMYGVIFYWTDVEAIAQHLAVTRVGYVAAGVALYMCGQAVSALKWHVLIRPLALSVPYRRILAFYFTGMFFNLFLPTIVGGDAVKALLLTRETGAPARSMMSVFMERNVGLLALLTIAAIAALRAPHIELGGLSLVTICVLLFAAFIAANAALGARATYTLVDRMIASSPLGRWRGRTASLYEALSRYRQAPGELALSIVLSFFFQIVVIGVVFLNARALNLDFPVSALAVFVPLTSLAGMIPVTVNGLGVREALYILLFGRLGAPTETAVALALLYLAVTFIASLPGGVVYALQRAPAPATSRHAPTDNGAMRPS